MQHDGTSTKLRSTANNIGEWGCGELGWELQKVSCKLGALKVLKEAMGLLGSVGICKAVKSLILQRSEEASLHPPVSVWLSRVVWGEFLFILSVIYVYAFSAHNHLFIVLIISSDVSASNVLPLFLKVSISSLDDNQLGSQHDMAEQ